MADSRSLCTDLYQLTMAYGYWKTGLFEREALFQLHFRRPPFHGGFAIAAGLEPALDFLTQLSFSENDLTYLEGLKTAQGTPLFEQKFLELLSQFHLTCDLDAVREGTPIFPYEPLLRVTGPLWQAQLLESPLLNIFNFHTLIATKAARICLAAAPDPVIEFGMRRAQGFDGALSASRAAYVGGASATSHLLAGKRFGIPVRGTQGHSWVMAFDTELAAFEAFAAIFPDECILVIDTYNSLEGVRNAIAATKKQGCRLLAVRLDSGDLATLSVSVREILDEAGCHTTAIMASNELDERRIATLKQGGAPISIWGVGTHLVTGKDQPALDGVYKLSALQNSRGVWESKMKISEQKEKQSLPGCLQIRRFFDGKKYQHDLIYDEWLGIDSASSHAEWESMDLLQPIIRKGVIVYTPPPLTAVQAHTRQEIGRLPKEVTELNQPTPFKIFRK